jgi:hypothetical protein
LFIFRKQTTLLQMENKTTTASSTASDGALSKVMHILSKFLIILLQCGACGTEHSVLEADAVFCARCGRSRLVVDLRVRREQFVDAAISKIIDAPDVGAMIDGTPANAVRFAAVVVCLFTHTCRSRNSLGEPVDVYDDCASFSVPLPAEWLMTTVLQPDETCSDRVRFRVDSHQHLLGAVSDHLPPQLALACQDSRVSSRTAAGSTIC